MDVLSKEITPVSSTVTTINNFFIILAFITSFFLIELSSYSSSILYLPLLMLLYDSRTKEDSHPIQAILTEKCRVMIIPFVFVCTVRFIGELQLMKPHISKPKIDLLYYLLNDRKIRRIRDCILFLICIPSYYSLFCICSGFFNNP